MKQIITFIFSILLSLTNVNAQGNYLSIGNKTSGLCIGNSEQYNGLRLNFIDKNVHSTNGLDISFLARKHSLYGFGISLIGGNVKKSNGICIHGLFSSGNYNGISITGLWSSLDKLNGIGFAGLMTGDTLNGVSIGLWSVYSEGKIKGVSLAMFAIQGNEMNGISASLLHNKIKKQKGLSISLYNSTDHLKGIQIGIINYAGNNRKLFRYLPFINFNFKKKNSS